MVHGCEVETEDNVRVFELKIFTQGFVNFGFGLFHFSLLLNSFSSKITKHQNDESHPTAADSFAFSIAIQTFSMEQIKQIEYMIFMAKSFRR